MTDVASRELRNSTPQLLDRVAHGEDLTITVDGRPVAVLPPVESRRRGTSRDDFARRVRDCLADPALSAELRALTDESTDDPP